MMNMKILNESKIMYLLLFTTLFCSISGFRGLSFLLMSVTVPIFVSWAFNHRDFRYRIQAFIYFVVIIVVEIAGFAALYEREGIVCEGRLVKDAYTSIYFSIVTWTTLGYGDCVPTPAMRQWAALQAVLGYIMMAIFTALVLNFLNGRIPETSDRDG
uniref:ion channel n=1 Tax=Microbulbifer agarilyticus TaxID=260552 RepID=UPI0002559D3C|nr:ion channel [Microbulbifer agarilyticus]